MRRRSMNLIRGDSARGVKLTISSSGVWDGDEDIFLTGSAWLDSNASGLACTMGLSTQLACPELKEARLMNDGWARLGSMTAREAPPC
jgi:hypothetical protein